MARDDLRVNAETLALAHAGVLRQAKASGWTPDVLSDMLTMLGLEDMPVPAGEGGGGQPRPDADDASGRPEQALVGSIPPEVTGNHGGDARP
jgi:hypothetical protein